MHGDDDGEIVDAVLVDDDDQPLTAEEEADLVELEEAQRALAAKVAAGQRPGSGQIGGWNVGMEMRRVEAARAKVLTWAEEVDDEAGVSA